MALKEKNLSSAYLSVLSFLDSEETGSEACLIVSPSLEPIGCGYQYPPDDEDKINVEEGLPDKEKPHDFVIPPGSYQLLQLDHIPEETEIEQELSPYVAAQSKNNLYIRMIKENALLIVIQLLWQTA